MALPRQVEAQLKELEQIESQLAGNTDSSSAAAPAEHPTDAASTAPTTAPEVSRPAPAEPAVPEETWQQKYRTLRGMYDADVPRLHAQVKELTAQIESIKREADSRSVEAAKPAVESLVTEADIEMFGQDLLEVQRKVAREVSMEFKADLDALKAENAKLRDQLTGTTTRINEASFEQQLRRAVPDFDEINVDERWIGWLNEVDPLIRAPRKTVAQDAYSRGDVDAVAHYVGMFKASLGDAKSPKSRKAGELERQIQPTKSASGAPQPSPTGRVFSNADISRMFKMAADLSAQGRLADAQKLEAEIDAAFMEGRVTA